MVVCGGCGGLLVIGVCNDVVIGFMVMAVVGYCSVKGRYFVDCDDGMVWVVLVG